MGTDYLDCYSCLQSIVTLGKLFHKIRMIILLTQVHMPNAQQGQTTGEVEAWSRESFLVGLWKEVGGSGPPKISKIPKGFQQNFFKDQVLEVGDRVCDQLLDSSLIGWLWGKRAVSQVLTLSVLRLGETWG